MDAQTLHWSTGSLKVHSGLRDLSACKQRLVLQFWSIPDDDTMTYIRSLGIVLHDYIPDLAYVATISNNVTAGQLQEAGVRGVHLIPRNLKSEAIPKDLTHIDAHVSYWPDAAPSECVEELLKVGATNLQVLTPVHQIRAIIPTANISKLVAAGVVRYVSLTKTPITTNLNSRLQCNVNRVQANPWNNGYSNPYGYTGAGYVLGMWDQGPVFNHADLVGRLFNMDGGATASHANHVAGTIAGDGSNSVSGGFPAWSLAGGSPQAILKAWDWNNPWVEQTMESSSMLAANNSWCYSVVIGGIWYYGNFGEYFAQCADLDKIVRNSNMNIVVAAGNYRGAYNPLNWIYNTIPAPATAKNGITVGAVVHNNPAVLAPFSSFGPTNDNRIKPDICAVGTNVTSTWKYGDAGHNFQYKADSGTSMAAPMVTGSLPHLAKRMSQVFPMNVFTDTDVHIKAALLNTATDIVSLGPDHQSGWGRMNVEKAVQSFRWSKTDYSGHNYDDFYTSNNEGAISNGKTHSYDLIVPAGSTPVKVMLVWADVEGSVFTNKRLVNDLDLTITQGSATFRPWVVPTAGAIATTGTNAVDNVEQVYAVLPAGTYKVNVKGTLVPFPGQKYALHVTSPNNNALMIKRIYYNGGGGQ